MALIVAALSLAALYSVAMYLYLAYLSFRDYQDYETETFHLGLCFILAVGFIGLILKGGG